MMVISPMSTRKTSVTIDEQLLEAARKVLSTRTVRDTIEGALREVLRVRARREEVEALSTLEGMDLDDDEIMAGAWR
jgi:Arc/MetJ family transcription regulator